mgnify:FL=1
MKKSVFISVLAVVFAAFSFSKINVACAQTIRCEVRERLLAGEIFLFQYDDEGNNKGYIWVYEFVNHLLSDEDRRFLEQVNGLEIHEDNAYYNRLLEISTMLFDDLNYNPFARYMSPQIETLHTNVLNILQGLISVQ